MNNDRQSLIISLYLSKQQFKTTILVANPTTHSRIWDYKKNCIKGTFIQIEILSNNHL